jgi:hypothetical protein
VKNEPEKESWTRGPSNALEISIDLPALRAKLSAMTEAELPAFGKQIHGMIYPRRYDGKGKPTLSAFSIQLDEARAEWRRRRPASMR